MREIKFRAWNEETGSMLTSKHFCVRFDGSFLPLRKFDEWFPDKIRLMQFTGLYDKDGKEIYEGDIMHNEHGDPDCVVTFHNGSFGVDTTDGWEDLINLTKNGEVVIGNIYENPEMLG